MCMFMNVITVVIASLIHLYFIGTPLVLLYIVLFLLMLHEVSRMSMNNVMQPNFCFPEVSS